MARTTITMPEATLRQIEKLSRQTDDLADDVLKAGADIVEPVMRSNLQASIGRGEDTSRSTGQLVSALGISPVKTDGNGNHTIKVGFAENRSDGRPNALLAVILEYGSSNRRAHPFLNKTRNATKGSVVEAMKSRLEAAIGGAQ
ncbi:MAG: HK97 gp10 family phage protein [Actinomycetaceae bacterium]|nr:HK97 gp10 family phage protein [Actinomycetaceae bacterium]